MGRGDKVDLRYLKYEGPLTEIEMSGLNISLDVFQLFMESMTCQVATICRAN